MSRSIKAFYVTVALGMGLLGVSTAAKADEAPPIDGQYQFILYQNNYQASGSFDLNGAIATNIAGFASDGPNIFYPDLINGSSLFSSSIDSSVSFIDFSQVSAHFDISRYNRVGVFNLSNDFNIDVHHGDGYLQGNNFDYSFFADLVGPSSGSSSSSSSGGAPSPKLNTLLSFLVVAGTVAFTKRRRGDHAEAGEVPA